MQAVLAGSNLKTKLLVHGNKIVVESAMQCICGFGTSVGGVIIDGEKYNWSNGFF